MAVFAVLARPAGARFILLLLLCLCGCCLRDLRASARNPSPAAPARSPAAPARSPAATARSPAAPAPSPAASARSPAAPAPGPAAPAPGPAAPAPSPAAPVREQTLPKKEIDALKQIDTKLRIGWNFNVNPCSGEGGWLDNTSNPALKNVTCGNCDSNNTCHVVSILLKSQNLTGVLPAEFANLTSLAQIDLTRNYINGSIPPEWGSLPLVNISLLGNRVSGEIPSEIGSISTLESLVLENNLMQGPIPPALGRLSNLSRLLLCANDFTGVLPDSLGNLKNLTDFRIDGTGISGNIPSFIGNWTKLTILNMQGTSLEGPFPSSFSMLKSLQDLKVSDFKGDGSFPPLHDLDLKTLILRNCSISGDIPGYIEKMANLKTLDLSFNNFIGEIPNLAGIKPLTCMYLTNNMLNGSIPEWVLSNKGYLDVSYNIFTGPVGSNAPSHCKQGNVNLVASYSTLENSLLNACLLKNFPCQGKPKNFNLFINCGGKRVNIGGTEYDEDSSPLGPSSFFLADSQAWASSSTGDFFGNSKAQYTATNISTLNMSNPELYMSARLNPLSLKYYGLCLQKGNYTVKLHFAEIIFTDDQTFSSVGRRFFDISIQGKQVLKDFNIAKEANGTGQEIIKSFFALVEGSTLEIHFQWEGKGTNSIPNKGVYGPLISAISVTPNFTPETDTRKSGVSVGAIIGVVAASCVAILLILFFLWFCFMKDYQENKDIKALKLQTGYFSLRQIKSATGNFSPANKIGEGGFGPVYKGVLPDGSVIAVKQLSSKSRQGNREFVNEIGMISALQHPNLVKLLGCCIEGNQLLLIYEYMENNSLARELFGSEGTTLKLDWQRRRRICIDIAKGLAYLHEESRLKIVHRDIKATNVLLDKDLNAKISDFGLAKLDDEENTHISTRIAGTRGYMAPEYAMRGHLTDKADVYSFGVVMLEVVSGKCNTNLVPKSEFANLLDHARILEKERKLLDLVDPGLGSDYSQKEALQMLTLALVCTSESPSQRPLMSAVVSMLESGTSVLIPSGSETHSESEEPRFKTSQEPPHEFHGISMEEPCFDSTVSLGTAKSSVGYSMSSYVQDMPR